MPGVAILSSLIIEHLEQTSKLKSFCDGKKLNKNVLQRKSFGINKPWDCRNQNMKNYEKCLLNKSLIRILRIKFN